MTEESAQDYLSMINLRSFSGSPRQISGLKVGITAFVVNLILFATKFVIAILSGSIAVMTDAINNLLDSASSIVTILGFSRSARKGDKHHPHGHGRAEYIAGFIISTIIIIAAITLGYSSIGRIISPTTVESSLPIILIIAVTILGKAGLAVYCHRKNKHVDSVALRAATMDAFSDVLATIITLVALIFAPITSFPIDGVAGVVMSFLILFIGFHNFFSNFNLLIGQKPDRYLLSRIRQIVVSAPSFERAYDIDFHDYGPEARKATVKVILAKNANKQQIEVDIEKIQQKLRYDYDIDVIIYWPPQG
jgi:cation diffusion facilitator family transporter